MNIVITGPNLRNDNFRVDQSPNFFPSDCWGGNNKDNAARPIRFVFEGTNEEVDTDIDNKKRVPRHARGEIARFFRFYVAKEGESLIITKTADRLYKVGMARNNAPLQIRPTPATRPPPEGTEAPQRAISTTTRIVRETAVTNFIKNLYDFKCQVCGTALPTLSGLYAEGAHIRPLGGSHNGPDVVSNVLCLCPNHHVMLDAGTLSIGDNCSVVGAAGELYVHADHKIDSAHLQYHRSVIALKRDA